jgi:hypothetical protein
LNDSATTRAPFSSTHRRSLFDGGLDLLGRHVRHAHGGDLLVFRYAGLFGRLPLRELK